MSLGTCTVQDCSCKIKPYNSFTDVYGHIINMGNLLSLNCVLSFTLKL